MQLNINLPPPSSVPQKCVINQKKEKRMCSA